MVNYALFGFMLVLPVNSLEIRTNSPSGMTFTVFVLTQDQPLTTDIVFPALTLFNLLTFPLSVLPMVITAIVEAGVAVGRITTFLTAEEIQLDAVKREESVTRVGEESVSMINGSFTWNKYGDQPVLKNINFAARKGELACIVGRVGQGKSSFLQSLIGDLHKLEGEVILRGHTAYVAQQSWVMNATVRENIIFGHKFDPVGILYCAFYFDSNTVSLGFLSKNSQGMCSIGRL